MSDKIDLQIHSTYSDGTYMPLNLLKIAKKNLIKIMAITDHDTVRGISADLLKAAVKQSILIIPAVELSAYYKKYELHVLGYGIDVFNKLLGKTIKYYANSRDVAAKKMIFGLKKAGYIISYGIVKNYANNSISRPHLAQAVINNKINKGLLLKIFSKIPSVQEFIRMHLIDGKKAYFRKKDLNIIKVINIIHAAGGLAVLSHPLGSIGFPPEIEWEKHFLTLKKMGLDGIEIYSPGHRRKDIPKLLKFVKKHGLIATGGSDFHNFNMPGLPLGYYAKNKRIPYVTAGQLLSRLK